MLAPTTHRSSFIFHQCSRALCSDHHKLCDEDVEPINKGNCSLHCYCSWRRGILFKPSDSRALHVISIQ
ncbi:hypothetical protein NC652_032605 [Populus alba x Populus x berolinensis]|uniref:Uncharacterized protein n=1 Tax=Populus alba x Populus x berolinensis TaxID=444605 RepID=A0AAD6PZY4_9ROSI|nr:hypothetical protein NC652_032605 [Populus alba x Populus x berolinensis]KAJ6972023.1 hypothetical protein NC653_032555 [Populus alba x Populus x berolinensis]